MDVICFGSIVVDHRRSAETSGTAAEPLRIVASAVDLHVGGVPILATTLRRMGFDVALMGCVGHDIAGYGLKLYLENEIGLNVEAVKTIDAPTSTSCIRLTEEQRYVDHTPGASAELAPGDRELAFVEKHKPKLMAIGYAGLLPKLDADGGRKMAEWIAAVQQTGTLVALDTHTVPPYAMLGKPVGVADVFICNREEACGITGPSSDSPEKGLAAIWLKFRARDPSSYRLLGLAIAEGVQLAYGHAENFANQWIANPHFGTFTPTDLTGAGDYFRAGVYASIMRQLREFASGQLDLARTGLAGHDVAYQQLR